MFGTSVLIPKCLNSKHVLADCEEAFLNMRLDGFVVKIIDIDRLEPCYLKNDLRTKACSKSDQKVLNDPFSKRV